MWTNKRKNKRTQSSLALKVRSLDKAKNDNNLKQGRANGLRGNKIILKTNVLVLVMVTQGCHH